MRKEINNLTREIGNKIKSGLGDRLSKPITKEEFVDTFSTQTYSLVVGGMLDIYSGARGLGILLSRSYAAAINLPTGSFYAKWRDYLHKKFSKIKDNKKLNNILEKTFLYAGLFCAQITASPYSTYSEAAEYLANNEKLKNGVIDLIAFNTFQVPLYATVAGLGVFFSKDSNLEKVIDGTIKGASGLSGLSPFIAPSFGRYMDFMRKKFGLKAATEKAKGDIQ
jgi:hypothetical protein